MRIVNLGTDDQGRSCVVQEREVDTVEAVPGVAMMSLFRTEVSPPPPPPKGLGIFNDMAMEPGTVNFMVVDIAPSSPDDPPVPNANQMHYNNTIELFCVLEGMMTSTLSDGTVVELHPGDCISMPGVDHATHAGPDGARVICMSVGMAPAG
jgi:mannose-6-phosphate isomerase-like protein (cupin superfamily)